MKICATGLRGFPNVMGGIETHCEELYPRLVAQDGETSITVLARSPYVQESAYDHKGVRIVPVWAIRNKYLETILHTLISIFYARLFVKPDVLHIHAIGPGLLTPIARLLGMKTVVTHHGADYKRQKWGPVAKFMLQTGERLTLRFANRVIAVGQQTVRELTALDPKRASKVVYVPNGASLPPAKEGVDLLSEFGVTAGRYILAVGRIVPEKGFQDLIAAHEQSGVDLPLLIVGDADHNDRFCTDLLAKASDRVIFAGRRNKEEIRCLYDNATFFVLPSYHEGLPIAALEALYCTLPVCLSNIPQNVDIGLPEKAYFPVGDVAALAAWLKAQPLISDSEIRAAVRQFDWDQIATQTAEIFAGMDGKRDWAPKGNAGSAAVR